MISIFNRIANRAKKLLILLIIIPLLTAAISYYLESKKPTTYTATSSVEIGNVDPRYKGDISSVEKYIKTSSYLEKVKKSSKASFDVADVKGRLVITSDKNILSFQITGTDEKEVQNTLTDLTEGFLKVSNKEYYSKKEDMEILLAETKQLQKTPKRQEVLQNIRQSFLTLKPVTLGDETEVVTNYTNPLKRGIFGLILGLMLDFVILITPELFREYR
ncbi:hypothetical protein V7182_10720 [Neobacillus drentensis]|uniref:hypothetical protein n=1 Tax=Neobacillus drentensis TaxID=220684 RepID=UPI002FFE145D